jgi:hypothetical protein
VVVEASSRVSDDLALIQSIIHVGRQSYSSIAYELESARQSRSRIALSLQQWDATIAALEERLQLSSREEVLETTGITPFHLRVTKLGVVWVLLFFVVVNMLWKIFSYNSEQSEHYPPWYHDSKTVAHTLLSSVVIWWLVGVLVFTELMFFSPINSPLSVVDSLYVCAQILTTVGYGDFTPTTNFGMVFMSMYAIFGVGMIATLLQEIVYIYVMSSEETALQRYTKVLERVFGGYSDLLVHLLPVLAMVAFGTFFFSVYPEEDMTSLQAFYFSSITLLTIGFGAYHPVSEIGRLVATFWMIIGTIFVGRAIMAASNCIFQSRNLYKTQVAVKRVFGNISNKGHVDLSGFIEFELTRRGIHNAVIASIVKLFHDMDRDKSGTLDMDEFEKYSQKYLLQPDAIDDENVEEVDENAEDADEDAS